MSTNNNADARSVLITKATELRSQGKSLQEIGKALGVSTTAAHYMLKGTKKAKRSRAKKPSLLTIPVESKTPERVLGGFEPTQGELIRYLITQHRAALDRLERSLS